MADAETDAKPVDQDALVADIDRTRAELARTIDAISDRVSPKRNVHRTLEQAPPARQPGRPADGGRCRRGRPGQRHRDIPRAPPQALTETLGPVQVTNMAAATQVAAGQLAS